MDTTTERGREEAQQKTPHRVGLRQALQLLRPQRGIVVLALVLTVVGAVLSLAQPLASKVLIDRVGSGESITQLILLVLALFVGAALVEAFSHYSLEKVSETAAKHLRVGLARRVVRSRLSSVREFATGDLLSRSTADIGMVRDMLASGLIQLVSVVLYGVGTVLFMALLDTTMLLIMLGTIVVAAILVALVLVSIRSATERSQASVGRFASSLERVLGSLRTVKAYLAEAQELERLEQDADEAYRNGLRAARLGAVVSPAIELAVNGAMLVVLVIGGSRVAAGTMDVSTLVAFLLYATYLVMPLAGLFAAMTILQRGLAGLQRVEETRALAPETEPGVGAPASGVGPNGPGRRRLHLSDVSFSYPATGRGISNMTLEFPETGVVAVIGPSGAGKSTLLDLMERFVEPDQGEIRIGDTPLGSIPIAEWRRMIALVDQEATVLDGSIRENLMYGHATGTERELLAALRETGLEDLVASLPDGIDAQVGERGRSLSGGERQRLALARAWLVPSRIVLLDEPTSHLDAGNTARVLESIRRLGEDRLVLVVAHHKDVMEIADQVVTLSEPAPAPVTAPAAATPQS